MSTPLTGTVVYHPPAEARDARQMASRLTEAEFCTALADLPDDLREDLVAWCARFEAWHGATFEWQPSAVWDVADQR